MSVFQSFDEMKIKELAKKEEIFKNSLFNEKNPKCIGILAAMEVEAEKLYEALKNKAKLYEKSEHCGKIFHQFWVEDKKFLLTVCGVGTNNATASALLLCERFGVDFLVHTGIAGALSSRLKHFDFVLASEIAYDETQGIGYVLSYPYKKEHTGTQAYSLSKFYRERFKEIFLQKKENLSSGKKREISLHEGLILTSDCFVSSKEKKKEMLSFAPEALACEMEGASTAKIAYMYGIEALIVRCISDMAEEGLEGEYASFEKEASYFSSEMVKALFDL